MLVAGCSTTVAAGQKFAARDESCNGKDDNCDGQTDERNPTAGATCYTDNLGNGAHACKGYVEPMANIGSAWIYEFEASRPDATGVSSGGNSSRACSNAGSLPWVNVTETQAAAACAAAKDSNGSAMRLCNATEWQTACEHTALGGDQYSFSTAPGTYVAKVCNDQNSGRSPLSIWATGTGPTTPKTCYTDWTGAANSTATKVYDLSGNVLEWTSTQVPVGTTTYYQLKGGSFNAPSGGSTCEYSFDIFQSTFANADVGFRCCADHAP
jgi:formylglycine-generating enzyme required for sulfatase activity